MAARGTRKSRVSVPRMRAVTCTLAMEMPGGDIELVNQQRKIDLHLIINVGHGIPLLPADAGYGARPAPGTPPSTAGATAATLR